VSDRAVMTWNELEAMVRAVNALPVTDDPLTLGQPVAWITRSNGKADYVSAVHHHYENGQTFCRLDIPPARQHLPLLPSLAVCTRCAAMSRRALHYAKLAVGDVLPLKVSA
jgi:hypothetical protein